MNDACSTEERDSLFRFLEIELTLKIGKRKRRAEHTQLSEGRHGQGEKDPMTNLRGEVRDRHGFGTL